MIFEDCLQMWCFGVQSAKLSRASAASIRSIFHHNKCHAAEPLPVGEANPCSRQLRVYGLEPRTGGISPVNGYGCPVVTSPSKYELFSYDPRVEKRRLSAITETNRVERQQRERRRRQKGMGSQKGVGVTDKRCRL